MWFFGITIQLIVLGYSLIDTNKSKINKLL